MLLIIMKIADFCIPLIHPRICGNFKLGVRRLCRGGIFQEIFGQINTFCIHTSIEFLRKMHIFEADFVGKL